MTLIPSIEEDIKHKQRCFAPSQLLWLHYGLEFVVITFLIFGALFQCTDVFTSVCDEAKHWKPSYDCLTEKSAERSRKSNYPLLEVEFYRPLYSWWEFKTCSRRHGDDGLEDHHVITLSMSGPTRVPEYLWVSTEISVSFATSFAAALGVFGHMHQRL
jgi:hypothetical protein